MALTTGNHSWWRPLAGTAVVLMGTTVMIMVLAFATEIAGELANRPLDSEGMATWGDIGNTALALLAIAVATPAVLLAAHYVQHRPAGTVSSVDGRLRRRRLTTCLALALPLVLLMLAVQALTPTPAGESEDLTWADTSTFEYAHVRRLGIVSDEEHRAVDDARGEVLAMLAERSGVFAQAERWAAWRWEPAWPTPCRAPCSTHRDRSHR
ncbi:hypothetical protein [Streptomyces sp. NPDC090036]|uniref:hypothetical protein n=1 Tax=Streptomyces sp. NPDC090036 TaxID=3365926 RepID=UPI003802BD3E